MTETAAPTRPAGRLPAFYQIVDGARWLERFVPLGLGMAQLRVKDRGEAELRAEIRAAREICGSDCLLVVNDHWRLALEEGGDWVHLGQEDLAVADTDAIRAGGLRLGVSTHDHAELRTALAARPDYVALGPVYPTVLKAMRWAPQGLDRIAEWAGLAGGVPLVAIGGFTPERAPGAWARGARTVCVVTDVLRHPDPEARLRQWLDLADGRAAPAGG